MHINLIQVPYHLGRKGVSMGKGPLRYIEEGAVSYLEKDGHTVTCTPIDNIPDASSTTILSTIAQINIHIASTVKHALANQRFPLIISGDCNVSLGAIAGINMDAIGIIWFDAHGDYNTPVTTVTNYFNGMPLAILNGHCYQNILHEIGAPRPVPPSHTILVGAHDLDEKEEALLKQSNVTMIPSDILKKDSAHAVRQLDTFRKQVKSIYLHLDIDILDNQEAPGVDFKAEGGVSAETVAQFLQSIGERFHIEVAALTAYNPDKDENDKTLHIALSLLRLLTSIAS